MIVRIGNKNITKVGVALSGGGIKGLAHIGVLKALINHGIKIDYISGTSAGAIIAALFACGYTPYQMEEIAENLKVNELVDFKFTMADLFKYSIKSFIGDENTRFLSTLPNGIIKGEKIERYFKNHLQKRKFKETNIPLAVTAVDIYSADTIFFSTPFLKKHGTLHVRYYHNITIAEAIRASISIPGVFYPKRYQDMCLVDGAVKNNLPTDILKDMGANVILGVDLGYNGGMNGRLNSAGEIVMHCIDIMNREVTLLKSEQFANLIIHPEIPDCPKNAKLIKNFVEAGEKAVKCKLTEIYSVVC